MKRIFLRKFYNFYELKKERKPIGKICYVVVSLRERRLEKGKRFSDERGKKEGDRERFRKARHGRRNADNLYVWSLRALYIAIAVIMAERTHLFPFRTQKLSFLAPKVLVGTLTGRIGHRRFSIRLFLALLVYSGETRIYVAILCRACVFAWL